MTYRTLELACDAQVAHVRLARPDSMNAMDAAFFAEIEHVATRLHREASARVMVISSTGKHFTAGMALEAFVTNPLPEGTSGRRLAIQDVVVALQDAFTALERLRVPVIAAIQGGCIGGGVDMVTACDVRYASVDAFFCIQETNIGITADLGTLQRLPKLIPIGLVREYAYSGRRMPAVRARELGLVNEVFPTHEATVDAALTLAREIASKAPVVVAATKQAITYARDHSVAESLEQMALLQASVWDSGDVKEAIRATKEKRAAKFGELAPVKLFAER
ncbi:MAG: enoyl-CoA hydratase-related protein [Burkholderiales bacterium]